MLLIEGKTRKVKLDENFFTGYRRTVLQPSEVLVDILIPFTEKVHQLTKSEASKNALYDDKQDRRFSVKLTQRCFS